MRQYARPKATGVFVRLAFFVPIMAAADWMIDRGALYGCLVGAGIAVLSWCLDAYLYFRQQRSLKPDLTLAVGGKSVKLPTTDTAGR
jgi:hypothetical protein